MEPIFQRLFPSQTIPPEIKTLLSELSFSRDDLLAAHPQKLSPPFSHPGLGRLISKLQLHCEYAKPLRVNSSLEADSTLSLVLFLRVFKKLRRLMFFSPEDRQKNETPLPLLNLADPAGLRYGEFAAPGKERQDLLIPLTISGHPPYSRSGLLFKLGQAWQLFQEKEFNQDYVAFDLETTGTTPRNSEIIEIAAVKIKNGLLGEEFHSLVRPTRTIPPEISSLTGINDQDVKNAPLLKEILPSFLNFIGDAVLVAHNIDFDFDFIRHYTRLLLGVRLTNTTYDTLAQARARLPGISHRLKSVTEHLGIDLKDWHRARGDARAAASIFLYFRDQDRSPGRYSYFEEAVPWACLGTIAARVPLESDNAIFFRYGLPSLLSAFGIGAKFFQKHPEQKAFVRQQLLEYLTSWRRKKRYLGIHQIIENIEI